MLDEFTYTLEFGWLDVTDVLTWLRVNKPPALHLVITGRDAPPALTAFADLVTEIPVASTTILNRLDADVDDLGALRESVERSFGPAVVEVPEGTDASTPMRSLIDGLPTDEESHARAAIVRSAAAAAPVPQARTVSTMRSTTAGCWPMPR